MTEDEDLIRPGQAARMMDVTTKTMTEWAKAGKVWSHVLPSGQRRYSKKNLTALLNGASR